MCQIKAHLSPRVFELARGLDETRVLITDGAVSGFTLYYKLVLFDLECKEPKQICVLAFLQGKYLYSKGGHT